MNKIKILGICGSLRSSSYNLTLLKEAIKLVPAEAELEFITLHNLPFFNQDLENSEIPEVTAFKEKIRAADAILFASPEYNYSIPGVLKNAIDLATRPWGDNAWAGKPTAIIGASIGPLGTARMQYHLRQIMVTLDMHPLNQPEFMLGSAADKINEEGELIDDKAKQKLAELLQALVDWTKKLS